MIDKMVLFGRGQGYVFIAYCLKGLCVSENREQKKDGEAMKVQS